MGKAIKITRLIGGFFSNDGHIRHCLGVSVARSVRTGRFMRHDIACVAYTYFVGAEKYITLDIGGFNHGSF